MKPFKDRLTSLMLPRRDCVMLRGSVDRCVCKHCKHHFFGSLLQMMSSRHSSFATPRLLSNQVSNTLRRRESKYQHVCTTTDSSRAAARAGILHSIRMQPLLRLDSSTLQGTRQRSGPFDCPGTPGEPGQEAAKPIRAQHDFHHDQGLPQCRQQALAAGYAQLR